MKQKNVCKFSALSQSHALEIRCFVLETNQEILAQHVQLKRNRAYLFTQGEGTFCVGNSAVNFRPGMLIFGFENISNNFIDNGFSKSFVLIHSLTIKSPSVFLHTKSVMYSLHSPSKITLHLTSEMSLFSTRMFA